MQSSYKHPNKCLYLKSGTCNGFSHLTQDPRNAKSLGALHYPPSWHPCNARSLWPPGHLEIFNLEATSGSWKGLIELDKSFRSWNKSLAKEDPYRPRKIPHPRNTNMTVENPHVQKERLQILDFALSCSFRQEPCIAKSLQAPKRPNSCNRSLHLKHNTLAMQKNQLLLEKDLRSWKNNLPMQNPYGHIPSKNIVLETTPLLCKILPATWPPRILYSTSKGALAMQNPYGQRQISVLETTPPQCKIPTDTGHQNIP